MSDLVDLYNTLDKQRVKESRERIPLQGTDFFDREHKFHDGFQVGFERGDQPRFTKEALDHYNTEVGELTTPESFDPAFPLHRFTPETPFNNPGEGDNSAT